MEIICIQCPLGCDIQVEKKDDDSGELLIKGVQCKLGKTYAYEEFTNPTRTVTSTAVIHNATLPVIPVRTNKPIPKKLVFSALEELNKAELTAPVEIGTIVVPNVCNTGCDFVTSRSLS